jgi:hypothetical protein
MALDIVEMFTTHAGGFRGAAPRRGFNRPLLADNVQLATLQRCLNALGHELDLVVRDAATGALLGQVTSAP